MKPTFSINWASGAVLCDTLNVEVGSDGLPSLDVARLCTRSDTAADHTARFRFKQKGTLYGFVADCVLDISEGRLSSVSLLFELIEFFDESILESSIVKAAQSRTNWQFITDHPASAHLERCGWGGAAFMYDYRQGDLSLTLSYF